MCATHPDRVARATCARCGRFACDSCLTSTGACAECADRELFGTPSALAVTAAIVGGASIVCAFAPGIIGIVLGTWELQRIRNGRSSPAGRGWAQAGQLLGAVALLIGALLAFAVFA